MDKFRKKEKGIALIFTLMILALLLILALGFALNSMFDQKAAYNSASKSFAGFLAQTQMQKLLSLIHNDEVNLDNNMLYSRNSSTPAATDKDMLKERLSFPPVLYKTEVDTNKVNWNYVRSKDSSQRIIGRTAFVVISDGISPASVVDPKHDESSDTELRIGKNTSEINIRHPLPLTASRLGGNALAGVFNWAEDKPTSGDGFSSGKFTGFWESFSILYSAIEKALSTTLLDTEKKEIRNNLSLVVAEDKEAFWVDLSGDTKVAPNEFYKRFDLTRTDWDTSNNADALTFIKTKLLLTDSAGTDPTENMEIWTEADSDSNSKGLPWLACFGFKDDGTGTNNWVSDESLKGTFSKVRARRQQIAANLKDYCDTDAIPTSDIDPKNWETTAPKFTGNEKTPYLNKIGFEVSATVDCDTNSLDPSKYDVTLDISVTPCAELIYIYNNTWTNGDLEVFIEGSVELKLTIDSTKTQTLSLNTDSSSKRIIIGSFTNGYSNLSPASKFTADFTYTETGCSNNTPTVEVTKIQITKVIVHSKSNIQNAYDYTGLLESGANSLIISVPDGTPKSGWYGFACHDPRQNLNQGDWLALTPDADPEKVFSITPTFVGKPNAQNNSNGGGDNTDSPGGASMDQENTSDPVNTSTAFIRDKPMESPWELGFIHRGAAWQTINLKKYDSSKAFSLINIGGIKYLAGGGLYTDGDANILDQVKMTPKAKSPQKIKLLSSRNQNFEALFSKIKLGCTINSNMDASSIASGGTPSELTNDQITYFKDKVITKYQSTAAPDTKRTRASVVDILALPDASAPPASTGIAAVSDAAQEELIGKIVNLTEVSGKLSGFTVIILAQTIKDIGGTSGNPVSITKYSNDGTSDSDTRSCEIGIFDAKINDPDDSNKNIYYDEITAEQKILARCYRAIDGTIKVTSIKYIE